MGKNQSERPFKVRLDNPLKARVDEMLLDRKISAQDAGVAMLEWIVCQDPLVQLVVLGQIGATSDILKLMVEYLQRDRASPEALEA